MKDWPDWYVVLIVAYAVMVTVIVAALFDMHTRQVDPYALTRRCDPKTGIGNRTEFRVFEVDRAIVFVCTPNGWVETR